MEDHSVDDDNSSIRSSSPANSPVMDRNPSPPPDREGEQGGEEVDAIGETVYSKHWLFSTFTRLIQIVSEQNMGDSDAQMQLPEEDEDELCKIWDMAMDKDVAGFLQEFKAADILLGVITKSRCPRLTEICVGILGNITAFLCVFVDISLVMGANVFLSRLLLTCVSQSDVSSLWLERVRQQTSVCSSLCFIMCSSTNMDLLVKVGELVDKLFDLDEELMKSWVTAGSQPSDEDEEEEEEEEGERRLDVASSLLEAAKQLRSESPEGLEVYLHALQLLTTIHHGIQTLAVAGGTGQALWTFLCEVVCEDLCQPDDPPFVLQEQKGLLVHALAVLSVLYACQDQEAEHSEADTLLPLVGSMLRVLQYHREVSSGHGQKEKKDGQEEKVDEQLQALIQTTVEFLSDIITDLTKVTQPLELSINNKKTVTVSYDVTSSLNQNNLI
uniref:Protein SAAL1 n=1 Tax=Oncorhynchus tshawytscha TaxID=74940 RepID=A0A8C8GDM6_ONCTS